MAINQSGIVLSRNDWGEIYYALESKLEVIKQGRYDPEDEPGQNEKWSADLKSILQKIGPDGEEAVKHGVLKIQ